MSNMDDFIALTRKKKQLESELDFIKKDISVYEKQILSEFEDSGISNIKKDGVTLSLRRTLYAGRDEDIDHHTACQRLHEAGLGEYAEPRVNTQGLSAYVRELDREDIEFPKEFEGFIKVSETMKIVATGLRI